MWRMHAILTRAGGGRTLDSPFFFNGSIPSAGECEKISSGVSAEGSENAGQSPSEAPPNINPGDLENWTPREKPSILAEGFF